MNIYSLKLANHGRGKKLIVPITTYQTPHLEAIFYYIEKNKLKFNEIFILDFASIVSFRNDYTWRNYVPFVQNIERKIRNGILKKITLFLFLRNNKFKKIKLLFNNRFNLSKFEIFSILKTFMMTEFRSSALTTTVYSNSIMSSINIIASRMDHFIKSFLITNNDIFLIFNGRHPLEYALRVVIDKNNLGNIIYHECNNYKKRIFFTNFQIHNLRKYHQNIVNFKNNNFNLAKKWLSMNNIDNKQYKKKFVTYFTSSFDEYSFAYNKPINQPMIISKLITLSSELPIKIRVHPNTINKSINDRNYWDFLKNKFPKIIINYDEDIRSYDLIRESFFTISIGSSIGPESILLNRNHLMCGNQHMYTKFNFFYRCNERTIINRTKEYFKKRYALKKIDSNSKELAASSLLFYKEIGTYVKESFMGAYPFKEGV